MRKQKRTIQKPFSRCGDVGVYKSKSDSENNDKEGANKVHNLRNGSLPLILLQFFPDHKRSLSVTVGRHFLDIADGLEVLESVAIFCQHDIDLQPVSNL